MLPTPLQRLWLRPWRDAKQQHLAQRPDVVRQSRGHGGRPRLPAFGGAVALGRFGLEQRQTYAGMGQTEIVVPLIQYKLLLQPLLALTQRADPSSDRGHMLADAQVDALDKGGLAVPA